jgi:arylsulfatase
MQNILFIMTDQQRWDAMGCSGGWVETPNLDRLAAEGVRFTNCVTTSPICVPARLSLATGLYPHNTGVWRNVHHTMAPETDNWMRELKRLGYRTSVFGKTHLHPHVGITNDELRGAGAAVPRFDLRDKEGLLHAWGLDDVNEIGGPRASANMLSHMTAMWADKGLLPAYQADFAERFSNKPHVVRPSTLPLEDYADVYVGQQAKNYLEQYDKDEPWCCWVSFGGPHEPWDTPEPYASRYRPEDMPEPVPRSADDDAASMGMLQRLYDHPETSPQFEPGEIAAMRANYAGNVTLIDDQIGDLLKVLEARGWYDDTIIVFTSDHGEMNGDHGLIYKMNFFDGSVRVPLIVRAPGRGIPGLVSDSLAENIDVGPTLLELAGTRPQHYQFARSLVAALDGGEHRQTVLSEFAGEVMLMDHEWKAVVNNAGIVYQLFNLNDDPDERHNLAGLPEYRQEANQMRLQMLETMLKTQSQIK